MLSEKIRRFGKAGMMAGFGFVVFAIVFYVTLPYVRFKDQLAGLVASAGYDMEAKQAGPSLGGGMTLKEVTLVSPATATSKATRILIDKATLSVSLLSRIFGTKPMAFLPRSSAATSTPRSRRPRDASAVEVRVGDRLGRDSLGEERDESAAGREARSQGGPGSSEAATVGSQGHAVVGLHRRAPSVTARPS
jgi:hypothetical protein